MKIQDLGFAPSQFASLQMQADRVDVKSEAERNTGDAAAKKAVEQNEDKFVKAAQNGSGVYTRNTLTSSQVDQLKNEENQRIQSFQKMLEAMVVKQGQASNVSFMGMNLFATDTDIAVAKKAIGEGGDYSVDAVAGRIMDMAEALSGGDESKIALLRDAVEKGFKAAGIEFGQKLPDISNQTYNEVMKRFDAWEKKDDKAISENAALLGAE